MRYKSIRNPAATLAVLFCLAALMWSPSGWAVPIESPDNLKPFMAEAADSDAPAATAVEDDSSMKALQALEEGLPAGPVLMFLKHPGASSRFEMTFSHLPEGTVIEEGKGYSGWCVDKATQIRKNDFHDVTLHLSTGANLPEKARSIDWHVINYLLNHKKGEPVDVQNAIWRLTHGRVSLSASASELMDESLEKGKDFKPSPGDIVAIMCDAGIEKQLTIFEYKLDKPAEAAAAPAGGGAAVALAAPAMAPPIFPAFLIPPLGLIPLVPQGEGPPEEHHEDHSTPEPSTAWLVLIGGACLALLLRRRMNRRQA